MARMEWDRLGEEVMRRRVHLGYTTRAQFTEATGFPAKTLSDLEKHRRENFDPTTLGRLERALRWPPGTATRILSGDEVRITGDGGPDLVIRHPDGKMTFVEVKSNLTAPDPYDAGMEPEGYRPGWRVGEGEPLFVNGLAARVAWMLGPRSHLSQRQREQVTRAIDAILNLFAAPRPGPHLLDGLDEPSTSFDVEVTTSEHEGQTAGREQAHR